MTRRSSASGGGLARRLRGHDDDPGARFLRDLAEGRRGRERPGPRRTEEQVAGSERERGHVALHADLATEVVEPHRERPHHQALAPAAIEHHAARAGDRAHGRLERVPAGIVHPARDLRELGGGLSHAHPLTSRPSMAYAFTYVLEEDARCRP